MTCRKPGSKPIALLLAVAFAAAPSLSIVEAQETRRSSRQVVVLSPERSDAGSWHGTWYFQTRSEKWAIWIRDESGLPEVRLQYLNRDRLESFITDWTSASEYHHRGKDGTFRLEFTRRDTNLMEGTWYWRFGTEGIDTNVRVETASFKIFRAERGRKLVVDFDGFERIYRGGSGARIAAKQAWTFHQGSRRLVRWKELPF